MHATHVLPCREEEDRAACDPICEEIKCKEKTRSCLNQTGSDFSLHLTWPIVVVCGHIGVYTSLGFIIRVGVYMRPVHVFIGSGAT